MRPWSFAVIGLIFVCVSSGSGFAQVAAQLAVQDTADDRPNIVYILADDLGYGELGSYGQKKIRTPNLDRLASEGMRFTRHYSGAPVCAPSRCVLMTGKHLANAFIRGNREVKPEGQWPIPDDALTIAEVLRWRGYATGCIGKWGLGAPGSSGVPERQGFDHFFGYNCQRQAHNFYPTHLWLNDRKFLLDNREFRAHQKRKEPPADYGEFHGNQYAPELMANQALGFVRRHHDRPFFLYLPFVEPHLAMQPPQRWVDSYPKEWDTKPYLGTRGYTPHPRPRAGYAAMISHLDDHVGRVVRLIDELELGEKTMIIFSSDNGATHDVGGVDTTFFDSTGGLRGRKGSVYEGGLRVPMIARWTGKIRAGSTTAHLSAFQDVMPTLADLAGAPTPTASDGISFLPTLLGRDGEQKQHERLVWEFFGYGGRQAVIRRDGWKGVRNRLKKGNEKIELFHLPSDPNETKNVAANHPDVVKEIAHVMATDRTPSATFAIPMLDDAGSKK